jgi:hypothetical protein
MILVGGVRNHQVFPENSVDRALEIGVEIIAAGAYVRSNEGTELSESGGMGSVLEIGEGELDIVAERAIQELRYDIELGLSDYTKNDVFADFRCGGGPRWSRF